MLTGHMGLSAAFCRNQIVEPRMDSRVGWGRSPTPPSNRTCRFPASGFPLCSRLGHSRSSIILVSNREVDDLFPSRSVISNLAWPSGTVCFSLRKVFVPWWAFANRFSSSRHKHTQSRAPSLHGNYPASTLLWAPPTPAVPDSWLCLPMNRWGHHPRYDGPLRFLTNLSARAAPYHPGRPIGCICSLLPRWRQASANPGAWPPPLV